MLRLAAGQAETLWHEALPIEVRELPQDLAALDELLSDPELLAPFAAHWQREAEVSGLSAAGHGRPTLAIETYVRLMVLRHRYGWGYRTLVAEVSNSIHLRRFCRIALSERVPRRVDGPQAHQADRRRDGQRHDAGADRSGRARAALQGADGQDPYDGDRGRQQASDRRGAGRAWRQVAGAGGVASGPQSSARPRPACATARALWAASCARSQGTIRRRSGEAKAEVLALTEQTGQLLAQSVKEARRAGRERQVEGTRARRAGQAPSGSQARELADRYERSPSRYASASRGTRSPTG